VELSIFEQGQPPHWRIRTLSGREWDAGTVSLVTQRETPAGTQSFDFVDCSYLQSTSPIPEPHDFVRLSLGHRGHVHDYDLEFCEHEHTHDHTELEGLDVDSTAYRDAHELAHAHDIEKRFTNKEVTNGQILLLA
jgi:ABC-type nickel/cobalt efflux system permease component RcnA